MEVSIFLAKVLGIYLTIVSVGMLLNGKKLKPILFEINSDPGMALLSGFLALIVGILIIVSHNVWVMSWPVIITIIGWVSLLKGIVRFMYPEIVIKKSKIMLENNVACYAILIVTLFIGLVLLYHGYMY